MKIVLLFTVLISLSFGAAFAQNLSEYQKYVNQNTNNGLTWWARTNSRFDWLRTVTNRKYQFGRAVAVVVGINDYIGMRSGGFEDLASPVGDSERMRDFLLNVADFDEVHYFTNSAANADTIRHLMEDVLPLELQPEDRLLFYWSGHGGSAEDPTGRKFGFLPFHNGTINGKVNSLHMDDITGWLRRIDARQTLFVIDACYSGLARLAMRIGIPEDPRWEQLAQPSDFVLTSSSEDQVSYGYADGQGGLFTTAFIEAASGTADRNSDGFVTIGEIEEEVGLVLSRSAGGFGFRQTPQLGSIGRANGRFFFFSGEKPSPEHEHGTDRALVIPRGGGSCGDVNEDFDVFVRNSSSCSDIQDFLTVHGDRANCTAIKAAERRALEQCEPDTATPTNEPVPTLHVYAPPDLSGESVTIVSWGGAYSRSQRKAFFEPFQEATGAAVSVADYNGGLAEVAAQAATGVGVWDLVDVEFADALRACEEGLAIEIDHSKLLPGADGAPPHKDFIEGTLDISCAVPSIVWSTIIAYDRSRLGSAPDKVEDFFDLRRYPGKRGLRKNPRGALEIALMANGVAPAKVYALLGTPEGVDQAFRKLDTIKEEIIWWEAGAQPQQLLADGEVAMSTAYNGRITNVVLNEDAPFEIIWDGQVWSADYWIIPKTSTNQKAALDFITYATGPKPLADQARWISYGPARRSSAARVGLSEDKPDFDMKPHVPTSPQNFDKRNLQSSVAFWSVHGDELNDRFSNWLAN